MAPAPGIVVPQWVCYQARRAMEPSTMQITTVGLDLAKRVFQVHGVDAAVVELNRAEPVFNLIL